MKLSIYEIISRNAMITNLRAHLKNIHTSWQLEFENSANYSKRLNYIDYAKGLAILLVVSGHVIYHCIFNRDAIASSYNLELFYVLQLIEMPLFMFLSGLVVRTRYQNGKNTLIDCYRKFRVLLVPFIFVGLTFTLFQGYSLDNFFLHSMKRGYWYLQALFDLYLIHYFFQGIVNLLPRKFQMMSDIVLFFILSFLSVIFKEWVGDVNVLVILGMDKVVMYFPIFYSAVLINKYELQKYIFGSEKIHFISLFILFTLGILAIWDIKVKGKDYIMMLFGIITILCTLYKYNNKKGVVANFVCYIGRKTLDIYIFHFFIIGFTSLQFLSGILIKYNSLFLSCCIVFPILFLIIFISIILGKIIRQNTILNHLIFYK